MSEHSSMHAYLHWTKERIDEMDAVLASLEAKAHTLQADSRKKADQFVQRLARTRDEFKAAATKQAEAGETAWQRAKPQMESLWANFEAEVKTYFETFGKQVEQQQATFQQIAAAQAKAWQKAAEEFQNSAAKMSASKRTEIDAAVRQMKAEAGKVEARLEKLKHAERESWSALSAALADSRRAFDKANQMTWDAYKRALG